MRYFIFIAELMVPICHGEVGKELFFKIFLIALDTNIFVEMAPLANSTNNTIHF